MQSMAGKQHNSKSNTCMFFSFFYLSKIGLLSLVSIKKTSMPHYLTKGGKLEAKFSSKVTHLIWIQSHWSMSSCLAFLKVVKGDHNTNTIQWRGHYYALVAPARFPFKSVHFNFHPNRQVWCHFSAFFYKSDSTRVHCIGLFLLPPSAAKHVTHVRACVCVCARVPVTWIIYYSYWRFVSSWGTVSLRKTWFMLRTTKWLGIYIFI